MAGTDLSLLKALARYGVKDATETLKQIFPLKQGRRDADSKLSFRTPFVPVLLWAVVTPCLF